MPNGETENSQIYSISPEDLVSDFQLDLVVGKSRRNGKFVKLEVTDLVEIGKTVRVKLESIETTYL